MTSPLPLGLAEQIEALKAKYPMRRTIDDQPFAAYSGHTVNSAIDSAVALCAEAWGKEVARLEDFTRCAMAAGGQQVGTIAAQAARIAELEAQLTASHNAALERAITCVQKWFFATNKDAQACIDEIRALMTKE